SDRNDRYGLHRAIHKGTSNGICGRNEPSDFIRNGRFNRLMDKFIEAVINDSLYFLCANIRHDIASAVELTQEKFKRGDNLRNIICALIYYMIIAWLMLKGLRHFQQMY